MRKLPDCPKCDFDELWLSKHATFVIVKCYNCGWSTPIIPRPADDALDAAIAQAVAAAKPVAGEVTP